MISIERTFISPTNKKQAVETMGLVFLTDLMFILRQFNFHEILTMPVNKFVMLLNGSDEDRKNFKEKLTEERE